MREIRTSGSVRGGASPMGMSSLYSTHLWALPLPRGECWPASQGTIKNSPPPGGVPRRGGVG